MQGTVRLTVREASDAWVKARGMSQSLQEVMPCRVVLHAVGPIYSGEASGEAELLAGRP